MISLLILESKVKPIMSANKWISYEMHLGNNHPSASVDQS